MRGRRGRREGEERGGEEGRREGGVGEREERGREREGRTSCYYNYIDPSSTVKHSCFGDRHHMPCSKA